MNNFYTHFRIYCALQRRDLFVLKSRLRPIWINMGIALFLDILLFGKLMPLMGLPVSMVLPIFLGSVIGQTFFKISSKSYDTIRDLKFNRFIDYHLTLPLPKRWLFAQIITSWLIESLVGMFPFIIVGVIALQNICSYSIFQFSWITGLLFFIFSALLIVILSLACSYYYDYNWFIKNIWPRRYGFLYSFGPLYFLWKQSYEFSPRITQLMLLNPFTYCAEGFRAAFIGGEQFMILPLCCAAISFFIILLGKFLAIGIKKRLDPV